jgi:hypothetical protein
MVRYKFSQQTSCFKNSLTTNGIIRLYRPDSVFLIIVVTLRYAAKAATWGERFSGLLFYLRAKNVSY